MTKSNELSKTVRRKHEVRMDRVKKFPKAAWLDGSVAWNRSEYIEETAQEILDVYGEMSDHDQKLIAMLADQIEIYIECSEKLKETGIIQIYNNGATQGPAVAFTMRMKALDAAVKIMNELGVTLKARQTNKARPKQKETDIDNFLSGPKK